MQIWKPTEERSPVDELTPGQRECLRLVQQLQSSKQIARKLGVRGRAEAALMLAAHDRRSVRVTDQFDVPILGAFEPARPSAVAAAAETVEDLHRFDVPKTNQGSRFSQLYRNWPVSTSTRPVNRLTPAERMGWILAISFSSIIAFGVLLGALTALTLLL